MPFANFFHLLPEKLKTSCTWSGCIQSSQAFISRSYSDHAYRSQYHSIFTEMIGGGWNIFTKNFTSLGSIKDADIRQWVPTTSQTLGSAPFVPRELSCLIWLIDFLCSDDYTKIVNVIRKIREGFLCSFWFNPYREYMWCQQMDIYVMSMAQWSISFKNVFF